jgi:hypothetical protein
VLKNEAPSAVTETHEERERESSEFAPGLRSLGTSSGLELGVAVGAPELEPRRAMGAPELEPESGVRAVEIGAGAPDRMRREWLSELGATVRGDLELEPVSEARAVGAGAGTVVTRPGLVCGKWMFS